MIFSRPYPYYSEKELADNLKPGSLVALRALNYSYIKSPPVPDAVFVCYRDNKFVCTLKDTRRPNANFSVDFFDIQEVKSPDGVETLYEKTAGRM